MGGRSFVRYLLLTLTTLFISFMLFGCGQEYEETNLPNPTEVSKQHQPSDNESGPVIITPVDSQENIGDLNQSDDGLYPAFQTMNDSRLYGYIDQEGQFVIEPQYDSASFFIHSLAIVSQDGTYKVINTEGVVLFENKGLIREYKNGYAAFYQEIDSITKIGFIDTECNIVIAPTYLDASDFDEDNTAIVSSTLNQYQQISTDGTILKELTSEIQYVNIKSIRDGYWVFTDESSFQGVKNLNNEIVLAPIYPKIYNLGYGLFAVSDPNNIAQNPTTAALGICDVNGEMKTDYIYYEVDIFQGEYASASNDQFTFFIDKSGQAVSSLPTVSGMGSLQLLGDVVFSLIDKDFAYLTKNGDIIWKADRSTILTDGIYVEPYTIRPNRFTLITYPQLRGLSDEKLQRKINDTIKQLFQRDPDSLLSHYQTYIDDNYQVNLDQNLLEVIKHGYDYTVSAAHGMPVLEYYYLDLLSGNQYTLDDLFHSNSLYISRLNHILDNEVIKRAQDVDSMIFIESYTGITDNPKFILGTDNLSIYFYPYEISAYTAGFQTFDIPYQLVSDLINTEGDLWNAFDHSSIDSSMINPDDTLEASMEAFIKHYETASSLAVTLNSFDSVKHFLVKDSRYYRNQKERIEAFADDEVYERIISCDLEKLESMNQKGDYKVYARVTSMSQYPNENKKTVTSNYVYTVKPSTQRHHYQVADRRVINP